MNKRGVRAVRFEVLTKMHNLKAERYVLFSGLSEDSSLGGSLRWL